MITSIVFTQSEIPASIDEHLCYTNIYIHGQRWNQTVADLVGLEVVVPI